MLEKLFQTYLEDKRPAFPEYDALEKALSSHIGVDEALSAYSMALERAAYCRGFMDGSDLMR